MWLVANILGRTDLEPTRVMRLDLVSETSGESLERNSRE